jgi:hypothetical protein
VVGDPRAIVGMGVSFGVGFFWRRGLGEVCEEVCEDRLGFELSWSESCLVGLIRWC